MSSIIQVDLSGNTNSLVIGRFWSILFVSFFQGTWTPGEGGVQAVYMTRGSNRVSYCKPKKKTWARNFTPKTIPGIKIFFPRNTRLKVARLDFWVTIPFNFDQLLYHHLESDRKSIVIAELEKDQSFRWDKFCPNRSYHSNGMTSYPILHNTE